MKILINFFLPLFVAILDDFGYCEINRSTLDLIVLTLYRDVKFMYERPEQMNVDAIFGLNFVQVHATAALEHKNAIFLGQKNRQLLEEILVRCEIAKNDGRKVLKASEFEMMIRPDIWNRTIFWRRGELGKRPFKNQGLTRAIATYLVYQGTPSEAESSRCLVDLLERDENFVCAVSKDCEEMLVRKDSSRGYPLTHRLLYVQTAIALGCREHSQIRIANLAKDFCTAILRDLIDLESMNFPAPSSDLAMEQILLCGMEGYLEFANEHYAKLIASWPNSHGCYSALGFHRGGKKSREKRTTAFMDHGCDNHASGVAAASLSLLVRSAVENSLDGFL